MSDVVAVRPRPVELAKVSIRLAPTDLALVDLLAARHGVTRSGMVRRAVDDLLARLTEELS